MIDWTKVKAGEPIESAVIGHRVWRYRLGPPLVLLSFQLGSTDIWPPEEAFESDKEPNWDNWNRIAHGIHGFKTLEGLQVHFRNLPDLLRYRCIYNKSDKDLWEARYDGVIRGTVWLWGVCIDCERGYRAQYAKPASFDEIYGDKADEVMERLRRLFGI